MSLVATCWLGSRFIPVFRTSSCQLNFHKIQLLSNFCLN